MTPGEQPEFYDGQQPAYLLSEIDEDEGTVTLFDPGEEDRWLTIDRAHALDLEAEGGWP